MSQTTPHLQPGTLLAGGRYKILRFIGAGGFGCTYEAEFVDMGHRVAIKEFFVGSCCNREASGAVSVGIVSQTSLVGKLQEKFRREAKRLFGLQHPGIVRVSDIIEENSTTYYVMDYIAGRSLQQIIDREGQLSEARALRYIGQVMDALEYIHGENMLHLDIKPDNIMVDSKTDRAILIDFGVSKQYDEVDGHNTSTIMGHTPGYAPPEQVSNTVRQFTPAADLYALGATLYSALTGKTPPSSVDISCGISHLDPLPAGISPSTQRAIGLMMQPNAAHRPQTVAAVRALLAGMENSELKIENSVPPTKPVETFVPKSVVGSPLVATAATATKIATAQPKSKKWLWVAVGAAVVVIGIVALLLMGKGSGKRPDTIAQADTPAVDPPPAQEPEPTDQTFTVNGVTFDMVYVKGGTFEMGATAEQNNGYEVNDWERPVHEVTLSDYYIGKTEVTQELWKAVMGSTPTAKGGWTSGYGLGGQYPAYLISYDDCKTFIAKLNDLTGQNFRMPTEAEWEYAARGGSKSRGYVFSGSNSVGSVAWYEGNSGGHTHQVATKSANELGLYDMAGNVQEWCNDWYCPYSSESQTNPKGPATGSNRVLRGGSWSRSATSCRVTNRGGFPPDDVYWYPGLRLAL